jgi:hypothetical protein
MVLRRIWCACRMECARSRLQGSAIARGCLGLNCTWGHDCGCVVDRYDVLMWGTLVEEALC